MGRKKNAPDNLTTTFLVRILDKETVELLEKAMQSGKYANRNKLVNDCIKGYLNYVNQRANPERTLKDLFEKEMSAYEWKIKKQLDAIQNLLLIISTVQHFDDKGIGYLINQLDNALKGQALIAPLPYAVVELGNYDQLPDRLEKAKKASLSELINDDESN